MVSTSMEPSLLIFARFHRAILVNVLAAGIAAIAWTDSMVVGTMDYILVDLILEYDHEIPAGWCSTMQPVLTLGPKMPSNYKALG